MLKFLRNKKTARKIWIVLAILIVPAFVLWGSGSLIRSKQESDYAGSISGKKITLLEYKDALQAARNQAIIQFGDDFSEKQKDFNLEAQAWYRLILLSEAKARNIKVSDQEVIQAMQSYPFFQKNGQFHNAIYAQYLQYIFHTPPRLFEEQTRQNIILAKLYNAVTGEIGLTDDEIKEAYQKENEQINIDYIASLSSDSSKGITPSEEDLKDYFAKNSLEFKQPLSFNMEYITLESKDKIKNIVLRLNPKEGFSKLAKDFNLAVKETGWFSQTNPIPGIGWSPEILNLISKAKPGEFLPPVNIDKYYYILRLKEKKEPYIPDFQEIKDKAKEALIKNESQRIARDKIEGCLKKLKEVASVNPKALDLDRVAKEFDLESGSTDLFKYGSYIKNIGASDNFWITAQKLKEDEVSQIIDMGPSAFYIIKIKSRVPIDEKKFENEKKEFGQKLLLQKRQGYFIKFAEELKIKAQSLRY